MSEQGQNPLSPNGSDSEELRELLPAYVLGALTPPERLRVQQLLSDHSEMLSELDEYLALAEGLLLNIEPLQPSASLRSRLLNQLAQEEAANTSLHSTGSTASSTTWLNSTNRARSHQTATFEPSTTSASSDRKPRPAEITQTSERRLADDRTIYRIGWILAAACLALLFVTNVYWFARSNDLNTQVGDLRQQQDAIVANLLSPNSQQVALNSAEDTMQIATVAWNSQTDLATFYGGDLPEIAADQVYQLWLLSGETPTSAAIFPPSIRGSYHTFPADVTGYDAIAISIEPAGGSETPTSQPFAIGELAPS